MSNKSTLSNQARRNFLKGAAYTSALSIGGLSSVAFAINANTPLKGNNSLDLASNDISVMQQQMLHKETVSLFNNSDKTIALDAFRPVLIERVNGSLVVKPNLIQSFSEVFEMLPGQRVSFDIQTTGGRFSSAEIADVSKLKGQYLHITSKNAVFNKLIPVTDSALRKTMPAMA